MFGGSSKPSFGTTPTVNSFGFNSNTTTASPFGAQPAFGKPATPGFGQPSAFGQQSNMFGTTQPSGLFGGNQAPAFGSTPTQQSGFGAFAQQQQANNTLFGSSLQQNKPSIFGQPSTSAFGAKPTGAFGFGSPTTHQPQTSLFGQASTSTTANTSFGGFGTNATSGGIFGATATPAFGQNQQAGANGSAIVKYQPLHGTDTLVKSGVSTIVNTKQHCITAMKEYEGKSLEEIRVEDYTANRKGPQPGGIGGSSGLFGAPAATGGGLFAPASQPSTGLFGQQQPAANPLGGFGTAATNNTLGGFGQTQSAFGQTAPAQSTGLFGKSFGTPATSTAFGGFGTTAPANSNLFGAKPFGQQSGGLFGQTPQVTGTSTFGQPAATGFSSFGQPAVNQPTPLFGATAGSTTNTGFGAATNTGFGGFGTNTNANSVGGGGSLFQQKPATGFGATPAFGATTSAATGFGSFGQPNTSGSMFNSTFNKPAPTFGGFGAQSTAPTLGTGLGLGTGNTLFGQSKPGGLFGTNTAPSGGLFGSSFGQTNTLGGLGQNTMGMGQGIGMQQQQVPIHQQILAMTTTPYGDNPIFKDLKPISGLSEDALRPTNPAAQKAILESSSSNQFKVTPNVGNGLKVKPIQSTLSKKSLFGGLEEFDSSVEESFCLKPNAKRLVLKPKSTAKSPNQSKPLQSTQNTSFTGNTDTSKPFTLSGSKDTAHMEQTFNNQIPTNPSTQSADQENVRRVSWLHSKALEKAVRPRLSDYHENTIKELVTVPSKETTKQTSTTPAGAELQATSPRDSNITIDLTQHNTLASTESSFVTHSFLDDTNTDLSLINVAPNAAGVTLTRAKYYTIPPLDKLEEYMNEDGSCIVPNFTIGRKGYGNVYFNEPIDIAGLNLDELVHFRHKEVIIYADDENKPPVGTELNRKAQITLDQVWPHDKTLHEAIKDKERLELMDYEGHLRRVCEKHDTRFIEYRPETGSWVFRVEHFSKYGLNDSDEDETPVDPKKAKLTSAAAVVPENQNRNLATSGGANVELSKTSAAALAAKSNHVTLNDVSLSNHTTLGGYPSRYDLTDHMDDYSMSQHRYQARSPSASLAMDLGTDSHKLQLMKASFFADDDYDGKSILSEQLEGRDSPDQIVPNRPGIRSHLFSAASSIHTHSRGIPSTISSILEIPVPNLVVSNKDLEMTVVENQTTKVVRPSGPKSAPLVVKPKVALIRFPNTVVPLDKSICNELNGRCASDVALMRSRSFKVGWGPQNKIFILNTINNSHKLANKTDQLQLLLKGRMKDDNSGNLVQGLQIASMNTIRAFQESIEDHLSIQLKFSTKHRVDDSDCPYIRSDSGTQIINEHLNIAKVNVKLGDVGDYILSVWSLLNALWGDQEELDGQEINSHLTIMRRKELLSEWLEDVVSCKASKSLDNSSADGYLNHLLQLLSCHKVDDACNLAFNNNDMNLALLMAQLSSGPTVRQLIQHQLSTWQEVEADKFVKVQRLKVMMLVAGVPLITSANGPINIFEDMDWLKAFATILWYVSSAPSSITDSLCSYEDFYQADEFPVEPPMPPYSGNYEPCSVSSVMDLRFHLLKLYSKRGHPMETILNPSTYTADQMDFRLSWLLLETLSAIGYHHCSELSAAQLHVSFASQLENHDLWHWSIFVLLHIENRNQREMAIQEILYKYVSLSQDEDYLEKEKFIINDLGVPEKWICWAKSIKAGAQRKYHKQAEYLLRAKQWPAAHDVIMRHLAPDAIINDDILYLKELLGQLENPRLIPNWSNEGMILMDYVEIIEKYESLKTIHERDIETRWEALKPQLNELCSRISLFPCPTAKHRLCQSEISQRLANLVNGMRIVCPDLSPLIEMKLTIGKLPLPQEYSQQKLRFFLDDTTLMDML
ncbi:Nuclear pore complex protein Nup98-Nup96 [Pseudolycoriella hygida]|uniref:Nuclear pore complex protein Nup98-Nup96 n=1 Tax=Pseudolycoriella hygida TaxID=35572 RepID=A0A9Q0RYC6_9DIPT|nr:Nuclear pore complex protein Nup98-Nup96 [Pseudolycoriella hygida]